MHIGGFHGDRRGWLGHDYAVIMWWKFWLGCALVFAAGGLLGAGAAHADDQSYLQYLNDHGTRVMAFNDATKVAYGYQACGLLRNGMSPDAIAGASPISDGRGIADAAQHELCPDTLRH